jgi:hypothetical protein
MIPGRKIIARLRTWFADKDFQKWDREIERDARAGKLDHLLKEARQEKSGEKLENL